jgi:ABC-type lipoprotein release transport system permease subunit
MGGGYLLTCFAISLSYGTWGQLVELVTRDHSGHIQIHSGNYLNKPKIYKTITMDGEIERVLEGNEDVVSYSRRVHSPALAYGDDRTTPVNVVGIDIAREIKTSQLGNKVKIGSFITNVSNQDGYYSALIGFGVADSLSLEPDDEIVLITEGADGSIANDIYIVSGIVGTKTSWEMNRVFLPLNAAQEFLSMYGRVHEYAILIEDTYQSEEIATTLQNTISTPDITVSPWQQVEETFYNSMRIDQQAMFIMLGVIIFMVCIGVLNTVLMSVLERTREFGVLRSIGTNPWRIMSLIFLETTILAILSCGIGFVFSVPLISWFAFVGIQMPPMDIGGVIAESMVGEYSLFVFVAPLIVVVTAAALVSIPPGIRAARITPVKALGSH